MDLETRKIEFVQEFLKIQSEEAIERLEKLLKKEKKNTLHDSMSIEDLNERIEKSESDFKNKRFKTTSDLLAKYE
ncbi:hypothetical protein [Psychroflexus sp. ALD_RP9]|uniref:hypothetical protein n=1 Tax=Psychroflexus sp. ALD_RP9 TaxID=2777186 RepID=UPI001A8D85D9|nr:hypothetical protein [Psychroflexus sp. ALD_RP9]QSS96392.1 hypothetical protein IMZ30_07980 [Psychroflexus sp. ALD_RP9]